VVQLVEHGQVRSYEGALEQEISFIKFVALDQRPSENGVNWRPQKRRDLVQWLQCRSRVCLGFAHIARSDRGHRPQAAAA